MEPPNLTNSLMQTMPYNSWKKRCFLLRFMLDQNPGLMLTLQIVLGMIVTLHPCMSFAILTVFS